MLISVCDRLKKSPDGFKMTQRTKRGHDNENYLPFDPQKTFQCWVCYEGTVNDREKNQVFDISRAFLKSPNRKMCTNLCVDDDIIDKHVPFLPSPTVDRDFM
jgi:hypothetical protein